MLMIGSRIFFRRSSGVRIAARDHPHEQAPKRLR